MKNIIILLLAFLMTGNHSYAQDIELNEGNNTYAVVIGISDYEYIDDLIYADKDAIAFANYLKSRSGGNIPEEQITLLLNQDANLGNISQELDGLVEKCGEGDLAIIYFSGHGDIETETFRKEGFLLCHNSPPHNYKTNAYAVYWLRTIVEDLTFVKQAKVMVVTDACRAGKLAGNQIGGAQKTSAALQEQFSSEIKILSCQSNEFSYEYDHLQGGIFTYHLLTGLYGLADSDNDLQVNVKEINRHLEDTVPFEADPDVQNPVVIGDKEAMVALVNEAARDSIERKLKNKQLAFSTGGTRGIEELILAKSDSLIQKTYIAFIAAIEAGDLMFPEDTCANVYFERLIQEPTLKDLYGSLKRKFVAALIDDAQKAINGWLTSDPKEIESYATSRGIEYLKFPAQLERAAGLLGEKHYMYNDLMAKRAFFQARGLIMKNGDMYGNGWDSLSLAQLYSYVQEGLSYNDQAPYLWVKMAYYYWGKRDEKNGSRSLEKAIALAPNWAQAYAWYSGGDDYDLSLFAAKKAVSIDSTYMRAQEALAAAYLLLHEFKAYSQAQQEVIKLRLSEQQSELQYINNLFLARTYFTYGQAVEAKEKYKDIVERLEGLNEPLTEWQKGEIHEAYLGLAWIHLFNGQYNEAKILFDKAISVPYNYLEKYYNGECYLGMAIIGQKTNDLSKVDENYKKAIDGIPFYWLISNSLVRAGLYDLTEESIELFERALKKYPDKNDLLHFHIGMLYLNQLKDVEKAISHLEKAAELTDEHAFIYYYLSTAYAQNGKKKAALQALELALEKGYSDYERIQNEQAFDNLRDSKQFKKLMQLYFEK